MLQDPYFPKYKRMDPELMRHLRRYYDVSVRYQDLLYARDRAEWQPDVTITGSRILSGAYFNGVWPLGWETGGRKILHLINLNGLSDAKWNSPRLQPPTMLKHPDASIGMPTAPRAVYRINPDGPDQTAQPVSFTYSNGRVHLTLEHLAYWSILVFEN